jgi:valyl-tRNA synthetase
MTLDKKPDFKKIEEKWAKKWFSEKLYKYNPNSKKKVYSIDTPPPTISGPLHIGHALNYIGFDVIARYKRMNGFELFFPIGYDNNGQPTERYVEKKLGIKSKNMPKNEFNKLVVKEMKPVLKGAQNDLKVWGSSYDWDLTYETISPYCVKTAQTSFLDLHKKGLVYRAEEPTIWCTECQTALSQADVESFDRNTKLNWLYFDLKEPVGKIKRVEIATTRPELLPACIGVFVHPDDKRYKKLVGKTAIVPIFNFEVPVMTDETVDMEFGSGCMMVCTFGDTEDIDKWRRYRLPLKLVITEDGRLNKSAGAYSGLKLKESRQYIIEKLEGEGHLIRQEDKKQTVGTCWRCRHPIEYNVTKQWFINLIDNKKEFIKKGKEVKWRPSYYVKRYIDWVQNLDRNWLISRQRHFGPSIPVWYCAKCNEIMLPDEKQLPIDTSIDKPKKKCKCGSSHFIGETDVFDTWMTSSLTPQIVTKWIDDPKRFNKVFPMDLRTNGHDIIRTWDFYTIVKALYHSNSLPWTNAMINGMVLDPRGKPMHKSLGNVIDPREMNDKYNADALRYWVATVNWGDDIPFHEKELVRGQKLQIKLWNTARFISMNLEKPVKSKLEISDKWILGRLAEVSEEYHKHFDKYNISKSRRELENFFYAEFCDFYLEMIKYRIYGDDKASKKAAQWTVYTCLLNLLKMWAPFMPFVTEEIYTSLFKKYEKTKSIHLTPFPSDLKADKDALKLGKTAIKLIAEIRKYKQDHKLSMGAELDSYKIKNKPKDWNKIKLLVMGTMRIKTIS